MTDDLAATMRSWSRGGGGRAAKGARRSGSFRALPPRQDEPGRGMLEFRQQGVPCVVTATRPAQGVRYGSQESTEQM